SIYYALSKMEKSGEVKLVREETRGSRVRRIYEITDLGISELKKAIEKELDKPLVPLNLDKFILPITFNKLNKNEAIAIIDERIKELNKKLEYWNYWKGLKINESSTKVEKLSFDMTISNYEYEIKWHESLIEEFDLYYELSEKNEIMIKNFDFGGIDEKDSDDNNINNASINELKDIILKDPRLAKNALDRLINIIGEEKTK
ncbi:MAG: PadR family transcriptional regulator, partial [Clostridium sp.]